MQIQQVKEKVAKLLAIAHNTPNEKEAANAAAMAHELMQKYRIEHIAFDKDGNAFDDISDDHEPLFSAGRISVWKSALADAIAQNNFCKVYLHYSKVGKEKKRQTQLRIVGSSIDVDSVRTLFLYLNSEIEKLCKKFLREKSYTKSHGRVAANSFKIGAIEIVGERLKDSNLTALKDVLFEHQKNDQDLQKIQTAMVKIDTQLERVDQFMQENLDLNMNANATFYKDDEAYVAGMVAGQSVDLDGK